MDPEKIDGRPSVLFDAVALLASKEGAARLASDAVARDLVTDAYAHAKFIGYLDSASELLEAAGVRNGMDEGFVPLDHEGAMTTFVQTCRQLRHWPRETHVNQT